MTEQIDTVIVGGGQAGLSLSYHLSRLGCPHLILERARIGESWRSQRWDSLMFHPQLGHSPRRARLSE